MCFISFRPECCQELVTDISMLLFSKILITIIVEYISKGIYLKRGVKGLIKRSYA